MFTIPNGKEILHISSIGELLSKKNESWKKCKSPGKAWNLVFLFLYKPLDLIIILVRQFK